MHAAGALPLHSSKTTNWFPQGPTCMYRANTIKLMPSSSRIPSIAASCGQ